MRAAAILVVGLMAACGGSQGQRSPAATVAPQPSSPVTVAPQPSSPAVFDQSQLVQYLHLTATDDHLAWTYAAPNGTNCNVAVILTTPAMVQLYAGAGDVVATNPNREAGVKVVDAEAATCQRLLTDALKDFPKKQ